MNIIVHENRYIDSIFHIPAQTYKIEEDFYFRGSPSTHEHIILNRDCAVIQFMVNDQIFVFNSNVICGKFTYPPKINIVFKNTCKHLTIIRLNSCGMFKLTNLPIASMLNSIIPGSIISIDLADDVHSDDSIGWINRTLSTEINDKGFHITREIIEYINENFVDLSSNASSILSKHFGISESTLLRYFKKYIGLNLATYILTLKRKKMIYSICNEQSTSLSAQENGYYDQSHFINDFKRVFGISLQEYFTEMKRLKKTSPELLQLLYYCSE